MIHRCQMYLRALGNACLKHYHLDTAYFYAAPTFAWQALLKQASEYCLHEVKCKVCELCPDETLC